ncbi:MAG: hypothetical protein ACEY26_01030 [Candidatus Hodgkinia cicadicola]
MFLFPLSGGEDSSSISIWASAIRRTNQHFSIDHRVRFESTSDVRRISSLQVALATSNLNISKLTSFRYLTLRAAASGLGQKRAKTGRTPSDVSEVSPRPRRPLILSRSIVALPPLRNVGFYVELLRFRTSWFSLFGKRSHRRLNSPTLDSSNGLSLFARSCDRRCAASLRPRSLFYLLFWAKLSAQPSDV